MAKRGPTAWLSRTLVALLILGRAQGASGDDVPPPRPADSQGGGDGAPPCPEPNPLLKSESLGDGGRADIGRNAIRARSQLPML